MGGGIKTKENNKTSNEEKKKNNREDFFWNSFFGFCIVLSVILIVEPSIIPFSSKVFSSDKKI